MSPRDPSKPGQSSGPSELVELVVAYAKQETIEPVRRQVKNLGKGLGGALLLSVGTALLAIGFVRALQVEFGGAGRVYGTGIVVSAYGSVGHLSGNFSWVPYMGAALFCLLVSAGCVGVILRRGRQ